jgi:COP9 signalosome complex subunit 3
VRFSLESHAYAEALPVIDQQILHFNTETRQSKLKNSSNTQDVAPSHKLRYQDVLEYFLGIGTIYIGLKQWEKALDALETVITYPVKENAVSKIMTDAYKRWVLVKVLLEGKAGGVPSTTNGIASKLYHTIAKPYDTIATLFTSASAVRLREEVDIGVDIWQDDGNTGLILSVLAAYQKFEIRNLAKIYRTLSVPDITRITHSAEFGETPPSDEATEELILDMIATGELHASMAYPPSSPAILSFNPIGPILQETQVQRQLAESLERLKSMKNDIKATDKRLTHEKEYLKWANKQKRAAKNGLGDTVGEDMMWNAADDEDLMGSNF